MLRGIGCQAKAPFAALTSKHAHLHIKLPTGSCELELFQIHYRVSIAERALKLRAHPNKEGSQAIVAVPVSCP